MARDVEKMQIWLQETLTVGSRIALIGENSYLWMVTWLAVASGFGVIVPIDRLLKPDELKPILERSGSVMFIYDADWHEHVDKMVEALPALTTRVVMDRGVAPEPLRARIASSQPSEHHNCLDDELAKLQTP